jgi:hypothetical protein
MKNCLMLSLMLLFMSTKAQEKPIEVVRDNFKVIHTHYDFKAKDIADITIEYDKDIAIEKETRTDELNVFSVRQRNPPFAGWKQLIQVEGLVTQKCIEYGWIVNTTTTCRDQDKEKCPCADYKAILDKYLNIDKKN